MAGPPYDTINSSLTSNLAYFFTYANSITNNLAVPFILVAFFLVIFLGQSFMQLRITGRMRAEVSFATAGFLNLGLAIILATEQNVISPLVLMASIAIAAIGFIVLIASSD